jgi:phosphoribosylanthranilate isomerase
MQIKICGLSREQDIDYVNEALPGFIGFVFAESRRQISPAIAEKLRERLADGIKAVGVFVNAPIPEIAALHKNGIISIAQLHGEEDEAYITELKSISDIPIIKVIKPSSLLTAHCSLLTDYLLLDSGAGSGRPFDWNLLKSPASPSSLLTAHCSLLTVPWFLAGGINLDNIEQAMTLNPFAIDISSGAETDGYKDREKILQLTNIVKKGSNK